MAKDLVQLIRDNPGAVFTIDNDGWWMKPAAPAADASDGEWATYLNADPIASDSDVEPLGDGGYGSGNTYGGDVLQALALIVGVKIESV